MDVNSVRYDNPNPQPAPWLTTLAGMVQGGAGQIAMNQARAEKEQEDNMQAMRAILPALAQQNRLNPAAPGTPGAFNFGGAPWAVGPAPTDYGNLKNQQEYMKLQDENQNPDAAMFRSAGKQGLADAVSMASTGMAKNADGSLMSPEEVLLKARQALETMRTGVGPVTPGTPGKSGFLGTKFGSKPAVPTSRVRLTKDGVVKEYMQGDGSWATDQPTDVKKKGQYTTEQEQLIQTNMKAHNRGRQEVIDALASRGYL